MVPGTMFVSHTAAGLLATRRPLAVAGTLGSEGRRGPGQDAPCRLRRALVVETVAGPLDFDGRTLGPGRLLIYAHSVI